MQSQAACLYSEVEGSEVQKANTTNTGKADWFRGQEHPNPSERFIISHHHAFPQLTIFKLCEFALPHRRILNCDH
jgi:hypothetical protein